MKHIAPIIIAAALFLSACNHDEAWTKIIVGEWHGVSWLAEGKPVIQDVSTLTMLFSKDSIYNLIVGATMETGDYYVKNDSLFLIPERSEDVKMKIISLSDSKLELQVFRGQLEDIEFKR